MTTRKEYLCILGAFMVISLLVFYRHYTSENGTGNSYSVLEKFIVDSAAINRSSEASEYVRQSESFIKLPNQSSQKSSKVETPDIENQSSNNISNSKYGRTFEKDIPGQGRAQKDNKHSVKEHKTTAIDKQDDKKVIPSQEIKMINIRQLNSAPSIVIYNRMPKCASSTTMKLFFTLNNNSCRFAYLSSNIADIHLSEEEEKQFALGLTNISRTIDVPLLYDRHLNFIDFLKYNLTQPVYINLVRDPLDRLVSQFYYARDVKKKRDNHLAEYKNMTFDGYVASRRSKGQYLGLPFRPFFCGNLDVCRYRGDASFILTKKNIEKHFLLVGVKEELSEFYEVLETLLPSYFQGLHSLWTSRMGNMTSNTNPHSEISKQTKSYLIKEVLAKDYDVYHFIRQRFHRIQHAIKSQQLKFKTHEKIPSGRFTDKDKLKTQRTFLDKYGRVNKLSSCCYVMRKI